MTTQAVEAGTDGKTITEFEAEQVERANATGRVPVVFVHGLWLLPSSWDRWATVFEEAGYTALTPGWPDDPDTVVEIPGRGHALTIDSGWREVADTALSFVQRFAPAG